MHDQPLHATPCILMEYFLAPPLLIWGEVPIPHSHLGLGGPKSRGTSYRGGRYIAGDVISPGTSYRGGRHIAGEVISATS